MPGFLSWSAVGLAALVAACGAVKSAPSDASADDAGPPPPVKVAVLTVAGDGLPDTTAKVVFQDPLGALVFDGPVDAMGHIEAMLPTGGTVTAIRSSGDTPTFFGANVTVITGVKPGDNLTVGVTRAGTITNQGGATTMTASFTPVLGAGAYSFYTACGLSTAAAGATTVTLSFRDSCHDKSFDLVGIASGGSLNAPLFVALTGVMYMGNSTFTIPMGFSTMANFVVNMTNIPDAVMSMQLTRSSMIESTLVASQSGPMIMPGPGSLAQTVVFPQGVGTRSDLNISLNLAGSQSSQSYEVRTATLGTSVTVDLGTLTLPWLNNVVMTGNGAAWNTVVPGGTPDGMFTLWAGRWVDAMARNNTMVWRVIQPASATGMILPRLPPSYAVYDPAQQTVAVTPLMVDVIMADYDGIAGYDELRQIPETLLTSQAGFVDKPFKRRLSSVFSTTRQN